MIPQAYVYNEYDNNITEIICNKNKQVIYALAYVNIRDKFKISIVKIIEKIKLDVDL